VRLPPFNSLSDGFRRYFRSHSAALKPGSSIAFTTLYWLPCTRQPTVRKKRGWGVNWRVPVDESRHQHPLYGDDLYGGNIGLSLLFAWAHNTTILAVAWWVFAHLIRAASAVLFGMHGTAQSRQFLQGIAFVIVRRHSDCGTPPSP